MKFVKNCKKFALTGALALLLAGCGPTREEAVDAVGKAMTDGLASEFAAYEFEERSYSEALTPATVFTGKNAKVLVVTKPEYRSELLGGGKMAVYGLAITRSGKYFSFDYTSAFRALTPIPFAIEPCIDADCRYLHGGRAMSRSQAMKWLFHSSAFTPELFKELFGEDAPPKRVEA